MKTFEQYINESYNNEAINEANLSKEFLKFQPGDAIEITKSFNIADFNYKKSARTWWGEKIANASNIIVKSDYNKNRIYQPGNVIWIFTNPSTIDSKGRANIAGYYGGFKGSFDDTPGEQGLTSFSVISNYDETIVQTIILALLEGYAKVVKYNDLAKSVRDEHESNIKMDRVRDAIRGNSVIYGDMEITDYEWKAGNYILKGYNKETGDKMPDRLVKAPELARGTFINSKNSEEITGDPFKK
jgi:hypothetical protein